MAARKSAQTPLVFQQGFRLQQKAGWRPGGFSLVELLIVIAVIVILIALLLPGIGMARARARQAKCASNLTQIRNAFTQAKTKLPPPFLAASWPDKLRPYVEQQIDVYICPDNATPSSPSFGMNSRAWKLEDQDNGRILLLDYNALEVKVVGQTIAQLGNSWPNERAPRHFQQQNVVFGDGHIDARSPDAIDPRYCEYYVKFWRPARDSTINLTGCVSLGTTPPSTTGGATAGTAGASTGAGSSTGSTSTTTTTTTTTTGGSTSSSTTTTTTGGGTTTGGAYCDGLKGEYRRSDALLYSGAADLVRLDSSMNYPFGSACNANVNSACLGSGIKPSPSGAAHPFNGDQTDADMNFDGLPECRFTAVWTGEIKADTTDTYTFVATADDSIRIWVNSVSVINFSGAGPVTLSGTASMTADQWVPIRIEFANIQWASDFLSIKWSAPSQAEKFLAAPNLRTPAPCP